MFAKSVEANVLANTTTRETIAIDAPQDSLTFLNANLVNVSLLDLHQSCVTSSLVNVSATTTLVGGPVNAASTDSSTILPALIVTVIREEQCQKCAIKTLANVFVNQVTVVLDVTCVSRATGAIPTVNRAVAAIPAVHPAFAPQTENVPVCPTSPVAHVTSAAQGTGNTPNVSAATVKLLDQWESRVTTKVGVSVEATLTVSAATDAAKDSTIFQPAKIATVIRPELWRHLPVAVQYPKANCANAKNAFKAESATSANHSTGTCRLRIRSDAKIAIVTLLELFRPFESVMMRVSVLARLV